MSYVYFITDNHGHIKIGKANDMMARMKELQTGNPYKLSPVLSLWMESEEKAFHLENALHKHLRNFQMEGEWFRAAPVMQLLDQEVVTVGQFKFGGLKYTKRQKGASNSLAKEKMQATFIIPGPPKGKGRPRVTRHGTYTPKETVEYENFIRKCFQQQCPDVFFGTKSISINAVAYVTPLKKYRKAETAAALANEFHPTSKPDTDNIMKGVLDALNGVAFEDDRYIYDLHIVKRFAADPRIEVTITADTECMDAPK